MNAILEMRGITKVFPGVKALVDVNLSVRRGEIHAICGENGAGKSTLMKVLSGVYRSGSYSGDIVYEDEIRHFASIRDSEHLGIIIIHQELALAPQLSIAENMFLGNEIARNGVIDWMATNAEARALMAKVGLRDSPMTLIRDIGVGKQQMVEIAKALAKNVKLLILDEPTASLNERDSQALLDLLLGLKAEGITSIIISHKLNEISRVADSITVLRDGMAVETLDASGGAIDEARIIRGMVGREMNDRYPKRTPNVGEVFFEVKNWVVHHHLTPDRQMIKGVGLNVRRGEVVGIAGLMGAGRTEFAMSVFGRSYGTRISGKVYMEGKEIDVSTIPRAINHGIAYVTEDRKQLGLILNEDIRFNIPLSKLDGIARRGIIDREEEILLARSFRERLNIRSSGVFHTAVNLSGGNQQKVVLSKWLNTDPKLLILDEPTRGIDVGAKYEIYTIINELADSGRGVIMISSEMPELLGLCDRIYVMNEGRFVSEVDGRTATQEQIMSFIVRPEDAPNVQ
jgi:putative multiple sugar transport system ATP-binding protein